MTLLIIYLPFYLLIFHFVNIRLLPVINSLRKYLLLIALDLRVDLHLSRSIRFVDYKWTRWSGDLFRGMDWFLLVCELLLSLNVVLDWFRLGFAYFIILVFCEIIVLAKNQELNRQIYLNYLKSSEYMLWQNRHSSFFQFAL